MSTSIVFCSVVFTLTQYRLTAEKREIFEFHEKLQFQTLLSINPIVYMLNINPEPQLDEQNALIPIVGPVTDR